MTIATDEGKQHSGINDMYFEIQARNGREDQIIRTQYTDTCSVSYLTPRYYVYFSTRMLDEMEDDLDTATNNLSLVTQKTKELIQKSGGKHNCILIVVLTVVVIILLFLIIYT
jgi:hypothetical protein